MPLKTAMPSVTPHLGAGALGEHQRHHAEDEGERGHQDRPQPQPAGLDRRLEAVLALVLQLLGELDDQDGVLGRQADQHHQADLREDVVVQLRQPDADDGGEQAHRHDQDDRQRQRPALVLRRQHQEDEHHGQREDELGQQVLPAWICW